MSWCGGGEISDTPGCARRRRAISSLTLCAGICPPSPGLEPCAILIWSSSANAAYSAVTPNLPDATCLMAELRSSRKRAGSSPPSPEFERAPRPSRAIAMVSWASAESAPCDIAPPEKRRTISAADSTSSRGTGGPPEPARGGRAAPMAFARSRAPRTGRTDPSAPRGVRRGARARPRPPRVGRRRRPDPWRAALRPS